MVQRIFCAKLKKEMERLSRPPYPGALGVKIFENISKEAWQQWMNYQTILINENKLDLTNLESRDFLKKQMEIFLFN